MSTAGRPAEGDATSLEKDVAQRPGVRPHPPAATPRPAAEWRQREERSNRFWLRLMALLSLALGRRASRLVLPVIALYFALFAGAARRASRAYLTRVSGRPARFADVVRHFHHFAATVHDRVYLLNERFELFDVTIDGEAHIETLLAAAPPASGRGVFLLGAHLGSFEALRALGRGRRGLPVAMVMYEENARRINAALAAINPAAVADVIALGTVDSMLRVRERLAAGALVGMLGDRGLGGEPTRRVALLGEPVALPEGPLRMAALLRQPVLFMAGLYLGGNRYRVRFAPLADFTDTPAAARDAAIDAALAAYAREIEHCLRLAPYNWFNFHDLWASDARD
jgi:predicted LPLAT superfamily acyltransferase